MIYVHHIGTVTYQGTKEDMLKWGIIIKDTK